MLWATTGLVRQPGQGEILSKSNVRPPRSTLEIFPTIRCASSTVPPPQAAWRTKPKTSMQPEWTPATLLPDGVTLVATWHDGFAWTIPEIDRTQAEANQEKGQFILWKGKCTADEKTIVCKQANHHTKGKWIQILVTGGGQVSQLTQYDNTTEEAANGISIFHNRTVRPNIFHFLEAE